MVEQRVILSEMGDADIPFLYELWNTEEVIRYADEFPRLRGWSKNDDVLTAWKKYQERCEKFGTDYRQWILRLPDKSSIGESFYGPLPEGISFGSWKKPDLVKYLVGDIKIVPKYWRQGYATEGMKLVVQYVFNQTSCDVFIVPPHQDNPAARHVYEKAGFTDTGVVVWGGHHFLEMNRVHFQEVYL